MTTHDPVVIVGSARTPMGGFQGDLATLTAPEMGAVAIRATLERAGLKPEDVQEVIMGCVLPAGQGQAPARQASLGAGIPESVGCTTINKMCGSGMKAAMLAHDLIAAGTNDIMIAGGMESMTNAPYLLDRARGGYRMGHGKVLDHMFLDGLEDAYDKGRLMGTFAEDCAQQYQFTREAQDEYAVTSLTRARTAVENGTFDRETVPVTVRTRKGETQVRRDEQPGKAVPDKIHLLKPAFRPDGTVTAANASSISDGAAALILMRLSEAERRGLTPLAAIIGHATHAQAPSQFATAPIGALKTLGRAHRLGAGRCRPVRDQRGVRGRGDGRDAGSRPAARQGERPWRRLRPRASHRRLGCARDGHPAGGAGKVRPEARHGLPLHRRR